MFQIYYHGKKMGGAHSSVDDCLVSLVGPNDMAKAGFFDKDPIDIYEVDSDGNNIGMPKVSFTLGVDMPKDSAAVQKFEVNFTAEGNERHGVDDE